MSYKSDKGDKASSFLTHLQGWEPYFLGSPSLEYKNSMLSRFLLFAVLLRVICHLSWEVVRCRVSIKQRWVKDSPGKT